MPIYTRTGDKGRTALFNGQRVSKVDLRVEVYGTVDELNSIIGVVLSIRYPSFTKASAGKQVLSIKRELIKIQNDLLSIGSALANPQGDALQSLEKRVKTFEEFIDEMTLHLPKLNNFILPGGGKAGAMLHLARAVARRLERKIVELNNKQKIDNKIIIYFNRLSDLLFTMARFTNFKENKKEIIWPV
ncbi:MAG: cob(I)yrinic acid a,c-diamide adenosyltransferase [Candidatus Levybacteria bacterium]|nr:cob(I)yrinic acid a,c-diamide adenosyltransferase [Candidatus Levybacteria bacterium]